MQNDPVNPTPDITFPVTYENAAGRKKNPIFKGRGHFTIRSHASGTVYVFSGERRALLSSGQIEREFKADEIRNVTTAGPLVSFDLKSIRAGGQERPFVFYCASTAEAQSAVTLLPAVMDHDFIAVRDFSSRLDSLEGASSPWTSITNIIIGLNVLVYVIMGWLGAGWLQVASMTPYYLYGANQGAATTDGEWWRLLTSMFMHYGILHLLLNMWALYQAGHFLERLQGRWLYALTYLGSGLAGGFASIAWHGDHSWSAGASGAVFGVYGAILGYLLREKQGLPTSIYQSLLKSSLTFAGYNILYGAARSGTDNAAHIGGVTGGFVLGWLVALPVDRAVREQKTGQRLRLGLLAVVAMIAAGVLLTPRFDYSVREELTWEEANRPFAAQENELLKQNQTALSAIQQGRDSSAHADWLTTHLVSFYHSWEEKLAGLTLNPARQTSKRRDELQKIIHQQFESNSKLATKLKAHDPAAIADYVQDEDAVARQISVFNKR